MTAQGKRKYALVTGGNKGIGFAVERELAQCGVTVFLGARDPQLGETAARTLANDKLDGRFVRLDVTKQETIDAARARIEGEAKRLDVLINNAGIMTPPEGESVAGRRRIYETNVFGAFAVALTFLPLLQAGQPSRIVNISSGLGSITKASELSAGGESRASFLSYGSSKAALNAITALWAGKLKSMGITIVTVAPGYTATDMNQHRGTQPVERPARFIADIALDGDEGKNGGFFDENGRYPW